MEKMEKRKKIILEFDDKIITLMEYLNTMEEGTTDVETRLNRGQINTIAKLMGKHTNPPMAFMEIMKMPWVDALENINKFAEKQGVDSKLPFLEKSQKT
jgi:hypothetical protein